MTSLLATVRESFEACKAKPALASWSEFLDVVDTMVETFPELEDLVADAATKKNEQAMSDYIASIEQSGKALLSEYSPASMRAFDTAWHNHSKQFEPESGSFQDGMKQMLTAVLDETQAGFMKSLEEDCADVAVLEEMGTWIATVAQIAEAQSIASVWKGVRVGRIGLYFFVCVLCWSGLVCLLLSFSLSGLATLQAIPISATSPDVAAPRPTTRTRTLTSKKPLKLNTHIKTTFLPRCSDLTVFFRIYAASFHVPKIR